MKVTVFGTGYVGLVSGACFASLGHDVLCMDIDKNKIDMLQHGEIPFFEPGIKEIVLENVGKKRLRFTTDAKQATQFGTILLNCVGTPGKPDGTADLDYLFSVAKSVAKHCNSYKVIVDKSTVPPGTARAISEFIKKENPRADIDVVSNPEFLKEGAAVYDFNHPDRIVLGYGPDSRAKPYMDELYAGLTRTYSNVIETDWATAELIKYASNTFLALKVSFINEMANICDTIGANIKTIAYGMGLDQRIGPKFLNAGAGYGGSCFPKDVRALTNFAKSQGYTPKIINQIDQFNERQKHIIVEKVRSSCGSLKDKTFCIWGLAFKPKTNDMRDAPSITIITELLDAGAKINAYDPEAMQDARQVFNTRISYALSALDAAKDADTIILVTEWDELRTLDLAKARNLMKGNKLFDGRNIYDPKAARAAGFEYHGIGQN